MAASFAAPCKRAEATVAAMTAALGPFVTLELCDRLARTPHVEHDGTLVADPKRRQIMLFLGGKGDAGERSGVWRLVQDRRVFQAAQVKGAERAVGSDADKYVGRGWQPGDVVDRAVVRYQLGYGCRCRKIKDGARRVD